ncbi:tetratricopeptide repeat protein [Kitasatospora cinereorecta]|uniref:Tetratricopeptide repeat protein n=1 Tax=Kitasatospora cinereorecta TaxID=285560 RepID=A0ABW0V3X4_9ACTN
MMTPRPTGPLPSTAARPDAENSTTPHSVDCPPYWQSGRYHEALEALWRSHALAVELGDTRGAASCLVRIGIVHNASGDSQSGIEALRQAIPVLRGLGERRDEANALGNLGYFLSLVGRSEEALDTLRESAAVAREIDDRRSEAHALVGLGSAARRRP